LGSVLGRGARPQCQKRAEQALALLQGLGAELYCRRMTGSGSPEHPLRLPLTCGLSFFSSIEARC